MFTAIYRWRLREGFEAQFVEGWERVTTAIYETCGSDGSRLHRCADGSWLGYACWPDAAARQACEHGEIEGQRMMRDAVEEAFEDILGDVVIDLLRPSQHQR